MSLNMILVLFQRYEFLISGQRQYMEKPKRTGGGSRTGEAPRDESQILNNVLGIISYNGILNQLKE